MLSDQYIELTEFFSENNIEQFYIHSRCKSTTLEYKIMDFDCEGIDIVNSLSSVDKVSVVTHDIYIGLREFFRTEHRQVFTLTFKKMEEYIGDDLLSSAYLNDGFWYDTGEGAISSTWLENGFIIQKFDLSMRKIIFRKDTHDITAFVVPKSFLKQKIPKNAQDELDAFFKYIATKYKI